MSLLVGLFFLALAGAIHWLAAVILREPKRKMQDAPERTSETNQIVRRPKIGSMRRFARITTFIASFSRSVRSRAFVKLLMVLFGIAISLTGLALGRSELETIESTVSQANDVILFDLPRSRKVPETTTLVDLIVYRVSDGHPSTEIFWHVKADNRIFKPPKIVWPIRYGQTFANTVEVVPAKALLPGRYSFDAAVIVKNDDDSAAPDYKVLLSQFSIDQKLILEK
jgi:hypothetical protein